MSIQIFQFKRRQAAARAETFPRFTYGYLQNQLLAAASSAYIAPFIQGGGGTTPTDVDWLCGAGALFSWNLIPLSVRDTTLRIEVSSDGVTFDTWRSYALYPGGTNQIAGVWCPYFSVRLRLFNGNATLTQTVSGLVKSEAGN